MEITKEHVRLQFRRLERHFERARMNDPIALLDMTHALRVWTDMKSAVDELAAADGYELRFRQPQFDPKVKKALKDSWFIYMADPNAPSVGGVAHAALAISSPGNEEAIHAMFKAGPPRVGPAKLTFVDWLGAAILQTGAPDRLDISREALIKRLANFSGASHPPGMEPDEKLENRLELHIAELQEKQSRGMPLGYYQLVSIASELIKTVRPWLYPRSGRPRK